MDAKEMLAHLGSHIDWLESECNRLDRELSAAKAPAALPDRCEATIPALGIHCDEDAGHTGPHYSSRSFDNGICWDQEPERAEPADQWGKADTAARVVRANQTPPQVHDLQYDRVTGWCSCAACQMTTLAYALHADQPCPGVKR